MTDPVNMAREVLLDALDALRQHLDALILVGAQAVYLHTGEAQVALAAYTTDGDLAIDPDLLGTDPLIEDAMRLGGFELREGAIGSWRSPLGADVDLMVPAAVAGSGNRSSRGVDAPPHARHAMRRAKGLEAALVDSSAMVITTIEPTAGLRSFTVKVAGPAALLVAKLHKLSERIHEPTRLDNKDAHDIYRLLVAVDTPLFASVMRHLLAEPVSAEVSAQAVDLLRDLFGTSDATGSLMAGAAEDGVGDPEQVAVAASILAQDLLGALGHVADRR